MLNFSGRAVEDISVGYAVDVDPGSGMVSLNVPLLPPPGRDGMTPPLILAYSSGGGNSTFGAGWFLSGLPAVGIDTSRHVARWDGRDSYQIGGDELVPWREQQGGAWVVRGFEQGDWSVAYLRSRRGANRQRVEKWLHRPSGRVHFRSRDVRNILTIYGARPNAAARIADPADETRTLVWLPELMLDPQGNAIWIDYAAETWEGIDRGAASERTAPPLAQRYLKRLRYGNAVPVALTDAVLGGGLPAGLKWHFQLVLDYGDHDPAMVADQPDRPWPARVDPFSINRHGFDLRSWRLCRRFLCFHDFPELGAEPSPVSALELTHAPHPAGTTVTRIRRIGYRREAGGLASQAIPPLDLAYSQPSTETAFTALPTVAAENLPAGLAQSAFAFVDLAGDGLPGILTRTDRAWFYKPNLGDGNFGAQTLVTERPAATAAFGLGDMDGDGDTDLSLLAGRFAGLYEHDGADGQWRGFRPFENFPHVEAWGAQIRWVDLNGDGRADLVLSRGDHFVWYPSDGEGFAAPVEVPRPGGADAVPTLKSDARLEFFFADMDGDGLADFVRVGNGCVEYWPGRGQGRFGDRVVMADAPIFDHSDAYEPDRLRFVDLDGSGTTDIVYLGRGVVRCWINASGNRFLPGPVLEGLPYFDSLSNVRIFDFLGDGRACLVWSSALPGRAAPLQYLPLTPATPARMLTGVKDGQGREIRLTYASSARHYLRDLADGRGWKTVLPAHRMVVDRREEIDRIGGAHMVQRYFYRDGFFDGRERQSRAFGQVDIQDSELAAGDDPLPDTYAAPTLTRLWFHLGTPMWGRHRPADIYAADPDLPSMDAHFVEDADMLDADEIEDGLRALAGHPIRREIYALDRHGIPAPHPFVVHQERYRLRRLQPAREDAPTAFFGTRLEQVSWTYEQMAGDPRIQQEMVLALDAFDQPLQQAAIVYARRAGQPRDVPAQDRNWITIAETSHLNIDLPDRYELGLPTESRKLELVGVRPAKALFDPADLTTPACAAAIATPLTHEADPPDNPLAGPVARLLQWERKFYWNAARDAALPLGQVGPLALVHHDETACFSPAFLAAALTGRIDDAGLAALHYVQKDGLWWMQSETHLFGGPNLFNQRIGVRRADGAETHFDYDPHALLVASVTDTLGHVQSAENDYHRLAPRRITDENGSVEEARYDPLGVIVASSRWGHVGDQPWGFDPLPAAGPAAPADLAAALADPQALVQSGATYVWYDLDAFGRDGSPTTLLTIERRDLLHDGEGGGIGAGLGSLGIAVGYLDGFGRALQSRALAEPGPAIQRDGGGQIVLDAAGQPVLAPANPRWCVSGHTEFDGKQQAVRSYESFYSPTPAFEADAVLRHLGNATLVKYDALGRMVAQFAPNGTQQRVTITPWRIEEADPNDTVLESAWRVTRELLPVGAPERIALEQAKAHAGSSTLTYLDPFGRPAARLERGDATAADQRSESRLDIEGRPRVILDPRGLTAFQYRYDMLGNMVWQDSLDAGPSMALTDAFGRDVLAWDARGFALRRGYDLADRPLYVDVTGGDGAVPMDHRVEDYAYGESMPDPAEARRRNLLGRAWRARDASGVRSVERCDPAGAVLATTLQLRAAIDAEPDWRLAVALDPEIVSSSARFDAIGRLLADSLPDGSTRRYDYDGGGALVRARLTTPDGQIADMPILNGVETGARGEVTALTLGNGVRIAYGYEPDSRRLASQTATRGAQVLQQLAYTYDPVGNIVRIADAAQQGGGAVIAGLAVPAQRDHVYDAHYRLRRATGRVHKALLQWDMLPGAAGATIGGRRISLNDGAAIETYTRTYSFDAGGNLTQSRHVGQSRNWTMNYWVSAASNRSLAALDPNGNPVANPETKFDAAGNLRELPHLRQMDWNWRGSLTRAVVIVRPGGVDDAERYVYGGDGQRVLRQTTRQTAPGMVEITETAYFGDAERKRLRRNGVLVLERWTLHVGDGANRLAKIHRWTRDDLAREVDDIAQPRVRYQLSSPQQSAVMELDEAGKLISYEEFFPFGETAFVAGDDLREVARRDYRFSGKERDEFTGLYYFGYRYLLPWLGRWLSPDPIGPQDDLNLYQFVHGNPVTNVDPDGLDTLIPLDSVSKKIKSPAAVMRQFNNSRALELGWKATAIVQLPNGDWQITATEPIPPDVLETARKVHDLELAQTLNDLTAVFGKGEKYNADADDPGLEAPGDGGDGGDGKKPGEDGGGAKGGGGKTDGAGGQGDAAGGNGGKGNAGTGKDATGKGGGKPQDGEVVNDLTAKDGKPGGAGVGNGKGTGIGDGQGAKPGAGAGTGGAGTGGSGKGGKGGGTGGKPTGKGGPKGSGGTGGGTAKEPGGTKLGGDPHAPPGGHGTTPGGNIGGNGASNTGSTDPAASPLPNGTADGGTNQNGNPNGSANGIPDGNASDAGHGDNPGGGQGNPNGTPGGTGDSQNAGKTGGAPGGGPGGQDGGVPGGDADGLVGGGGTHKLPWFLKWMNYAGKAVQFVGAVLEIAAGLAMLIAPEPTVTKVGGVILLLHGLDSLQALIRGERTYTAKAATGIARHCGASQKNAELIGDIADIAVPLLAGGLGAVGRMGARGAWKIPGFKVTPGWKIPGTGGYATWLMKGASNDAAILKLSKEDRKLYELGQRTLSGKDFEAMGKAMGTAARDASSVEGAIARGKWLQSQNAGRLFGKYSPSFWGLIRPHLVNEAGKTVLKFGTLGTGPTPAARAWGSAVFPLMAAEIDAISKALFLASSNGERAH